MKTDHQIKSDVIAELEWAPAVNPTNVGVSARDGVVTVTGQVNTYLQKHAVERAVRRVSGVRGIVMDLEVRLDPAHERTDVDIAQAALHALRWHSLVPDDCVKVEVDHGWVTLSGELEWPYQKASAEQCIRPLLGVRGISNDIRLKQQASASDLRQRIAAAFERHASREAAHLDIEVDGSVVTLRGTVDTLAERHAAVGTASAAKGVTRVIDRIEVAG